jgi:hypothetical protein
MANGSYFHYDDDKAIYVSKKFDMYQRYWRDVMESECTDNWQMYNGWDQYIRRRREESRSSLQMPTLFPAIEGRISQIMSKLTSREPIIQFKAIRKNDPLAVLSALKVQHWVREVLERQNWLDEIMVTMVAAEIFPLVWVKCRIGQIDMTPAEQIELAEIFSLPPDMFAGQKRYVPEFEVLSPGCVYYDYRANTPGQFVQKFHVKEMNLDEIYERYGSDMVLKLENHQSKQDQWVKDWEEAAGRKSYREEGEDRWRLAEGWINAVMSDGTVQRKIVRFFPDVVRDEFGNTPVGLLVEEEDPAESFDPFIHVTSRRLPFQLAGKPTVSLGKVFQREASELTNMAIDILGYTAAPPIVMQKGAVDNPSALQFTARSLWMINEDVSMPPQALHVPAPNAPFLQSMVQSMNENMNHITAAYEGITGQPHQGAGDETLGAFRQRTASAVGRLDMPLLGYSRLIAGIAERYWYYMREYPRTILARTPVGVQTPVGAFPVTQEDTGVGMVVKIENLTNFENNEIKKIELDRAIERTLPFPIAQMNPALMQVLLELYWRNHITDPDDYEAFMIALRGPLDPSLAAGKGGGGTDNRGMPMTQFSPGVGDTQRSAGLVSATTAGGG